MMRSVAMDHNDHGAYHHVQRGTSDDGGCDDQLMFRH
jgi:hypothetical protein